MPTIRKYVGTLRDYMASPGEKSLIIDPVTQTYTITGEGASQFNESDEQIKRIFWLLHTGWSTENKYGYYFMQRQKQNMTANLSWLQIQQ